MSDQIVKQEPVETLANTLRREDVIEKFAICLGNDKEAKRYVQSVIILVETSPVDGEYTLRKCSRNSIVAAALRAAYHRVSVDQADREAFLIPYKNNGVLEARFQLHYQEELNRFMRTGKYRYINVTPVFEGSEVWEDYQTGLLYIQEANGLMTEPEKVTRLRRFSDRKGKRIGWMGSYETTRGQKKMIYLPMEEIERRKGFNKASGSSFMWSNHRETAEMKTTLRALLRLADLKAEGMEVVREVMEEVEKMENGETEAPAETLADTGEVDSVFDDIMEGVIESEPGPAHTEAENLDALGFEMPARRVPPAVVAPAPRKPAQAVSEGEQKPPAEVSIIFGRFKLGDMDVRELDALSKDESKAATLRNAAKVVLGWKTR